MENNTDNWVLDGILQANKMKCVPGLHPGLNDLIRVLAKQAHCVSRTLILCEPHIPTAVRKTKFHKHCSPNRKNMSDSGISSRASLWTPIRPQTYYYDCFNYTNYPERETVYQDIELKYNALKDKRLQYSPPSCDENKVKRSLESPSRQKRLGEQMVGSHPLKSNKPMVVEADSTSSIPPVLLTSSEEVRENEKVYSSHESASDRSAGDLSEGSSTKVKFHSDTDDSDDDSKSKFKRKPTGWPGGGMKLAAAAAVAAANAAIKDSETVPCSELIDLQNLIRKSDRENFERMQELLMLMKELSAKDFCRATCSQRFDDTGKMKGDISERHLSEKSQTSTRKGKKTPESSDEKLDESKDHFRDSSTSSVQSSSGKDSSSVKSKSSSNLQRTESESSFDHHPVPYLHDTDEEMTDSECEDRPTTSESSFGKSGHASEKTRSDTSQKMEATDSSQSFKSDQSSGKKTGATDSSRSLKSNRSGGGKKDATDSSQSFKSDRPGGQQDATDSSRSFKSENSDKKMKTDSKKTLKNEESGKQVDIKDSSQSLKRKQSAAKSSELMKDRSKQSTNENGQNNVLLTVCDSPMTIHEVVEVSNIITDILVLETVKELEKMGKYSPPSKREGGSSPSMISVSTSGPPFEVTKDISTKPSESSVKGHSLKSVTLPSPTHQDSKTPTEGSIVASSASPKSSEKPELTRDDGEEPKFEAIKTETSRTKSVASMGSRRSGDRKSVASSVKSMGESPKVESKESKGGDASVAGSLRLDESKKTIDDKSGKGSTKSMRETKTGSIRSRTGSDGSKEGSPRSEGSNKADVDVSVTSKSESIKARSEASKILGAIGVSKPTNERSTPGSLGSKKGDGGAGSSRSMGEISKTETMKSKMSVDGVDHGSRKSVAAKPKAGSVSSKIGDEMKAVAGTPQTGSRASDGDTSKTSSMKSPISDKTSVQGSVASSGHRRTSSCPKHSRSPSVESPSKISTTSKTAAEKMKILNMASTTSKKIQKDKRERLSGDATKLSAIDSVCEREDSLVCVDYGKDSTVVYYVRITENAYPPVKESYSAPGFMLKSAYDYTIPPRGQVNVKTDLVLELPPGSYGRIAARKCLAVNFGIDVGADVIDRDYRDNVTVLLFNHSDKPFPVRKGNKVAQLICESIHQAEAKEKCDLLNAD
ncbi:hypothetical protein GE061_012984 [Apolygus lucorum]|uniref:dUTP diphosphatase n=1 Tax=Apolygus lucorum TaxID=248454 RepID=A0A8S9XVX0_APOLU|nr:hypothetical protein GE061_012984 [Apolygus lucorum]